MRMPVSRAGCSDVTLWKGVGMLGADALFALWARPRPLAVPE